MSHYAERMQLAAKHEARVLASLIKHGWAAGRADLISEELRRLLTPSSSQQRWSRANVLRWVPDLFAVRGAAKYLVEAKADTSATANHAIEYMAINSYERWYQHTGMAVVLVWCDGRVNLHGDILRDGSPARFHDGTNTRGSGTPFYLWPKSETRPWTQVFGPTASVFGADPAWKVA